MIPYIELGNHHPIFAFRMIDDATHDNYWPNLLISIVPRITGTISSLSSLVIIFLIFRSDTKFSSIYHRIMFGMSISSFIASVALALTSIPMPKHMPLEDELGLHWPGLRYGNTATCNIQGFSVMFGLITMFGFHSMLCVCK